MTKLTAAAYAAANPANGMTDQLHHGFGWAFEQMEAGKLVRRRFWSKSAFIVLEECGSPAGLPEINRHRRHGSGSGIADRWTRPICDLLAKDWVEVK